MGLLNQAAKEAATKKKPAEERSAPGEVDVLVRQRIEEMVASGLIVEAQTPTPQFIKDPRTGAFINTSNIVPEEKKSLVKKLKPITEKPALPLRLVNRQVSEGGRFFFKEVLQHFADGAWVDVPVVNEDDDYYYVEE